jgi:hypothetical protein
LRHGRREVAADSVLLAVAVQHASLNLIFLNKKERDAFNETKRIARNLFIVEYDGYSSRKKKSSNNAQNVLNIYSPVGSTEEDLGKSSNHL